MARCTRTSVALPSVPSDRSRRSTLCCFFQAAISTISCLLLHGIATSIGLGARAAVTCAALAAVEPLSLVTTGSVLTEPLYVTLLLLALWLVLRCPNAIVSFVSGLTWGVASLVRGVGLFAAFGLALHWLVFKTWPRRSLPLVLFWLGLSAPLLWWSGYNAVHYGVFSPGCSLTWNLAVSWAGVPKQRAEGLVPEATMDTWQREMGADSVEPNPFVMSRKAAALAIQWMLGHPWLMAKELCRSTMVF
jgi:4-amino-4-deoxy-L-arabinose transferase-like glycosyltransferase